MVMFNGINAALDQQAQPRKTDVLLNPTADQAPAGQPANSQSTPASTAITPDAATGNASTGQAPAASPQAARSPQAVLDANKNVSIQNTAATTAQENAKNIQAQQQAKIEAYKPEATQNYAATEKYVNEGGAAPARVDSAQSIAAAPKADVQAINDLRTSFNSDPTKGITNAVDRTLAQRDNVYRQQALQAQAALGQAGNSLTDASTQAAAREKAARDASAADDARINPFLASQDQTLQEAGNRALFNKESAFYQEKDREDAAARAQYDAQVQAALAQLNTGRNAGSQAGLKDLQSAAAFNIAPSGVPTGVSGQTLLSPDEFARYNRILALEGKPQLANQTTPDFDYNNSYDAAATQGKINQFIAQQQELARIGALTPASAPVVTNGITGQVDTNIAKPSQNAPSRLKKILGYVGL